MHSKALGFEPNRNCWGRCFIVRGYCLPLQQAVRRDNFRYTKNQTLGSWVRFSNATFVLSHTTPLVFFRKLQHQACQSMAGYFLIRKTVFFRILDQWGSIGPSVLPTEHPEWHLANQDLPEHGQDHLCTSLHGPVHSDRCQLPAGSLRCHRPHLFLWQLCHCISCLCCSGWHHISYCVHQDQ